MSLLPFATNINETQSYFLKTSELSTINGITNSTIFSTIQGWSMFPAVSPIDCANQPILSTTSLQLDNVTLTATYDELLINGVPVVTSTAFAQLSSITDWAYFEALSTVNMDGNDIINAKNIASQNIYNSLNIQTDTLTALTTLSAPKANITTINATNMSTINFKATNIATSNINGSPYVATSNWAKYPALNSTINANGANIVSGTNNTMNITADSNLYISSAYSAVSINSGFNLYSGQQPVTINGGNQSGFIADGGLFGIGNETYLNLNAKGGYRGHVVIQADGGGNAQTPNGISGTVEITANGSSFSNVGTGGTILINANNAGFGTTLTSKIAMSASCVESYAGYTGARLSLRGYNYVFADTGVCICTSLLPPSLFQTPGTTYLYGDNGIVCGSQVYVYGGIKPYSNGITAPKNLVISGRPDIDPKAYVICSNVDSIYMDGSANIFQVLNMTGQLQSVISGFSNIGSKNFYADLLVSAPTISGNNINTSNLTASNAVTATYGNFTYINGSPVGLQSTFSNLYTSNLFASNAVVSSILVGGERPLTHYISSFGTASISSLTVSTINGSHPITNYISSFGTASISSLSVSTINGSHPITQYISTFPFVYSQSTLYAPTVSTENILSGTTLSLTSLNDIALVSQAGRELFLASQYVFPGGPIIANTLTASNISCYALNVSSINGVAQPGFVPF